MTPDPRAPLNSRASNLGGADAVGANQISAAAFYTHRRSGVLPLAPTNERAVQGLHAPPPRGGIGGTARPPAIHTADAIVRLATRLLERSARLLRKARA